MNKFDERMSLSYTDRAGFSENSCGRNLLELMEQKKTNLTFGADISDGDELLKLVKETGEELAVVKTHVDIIDSYSSRHTEELADLAKDLGFLIFEDRKFVDIGKTVKRQYEGGTFRIADWAHIVNAHTVPGPGIIDGLYEVARPMIEKGLDRGLLLLAQMTSKGTLATGGYTVKSVAMAKENPEFVMGYIGAGSVPPELKKLASIVELYQVIMTPGIKIGASYDGLGQQYAAPEEAIRAGSDNLIVGSGIYGAASSVEAAKKYRKIGWETYIERLK